MIGIGIIGYGYWGPNLVRNFFEVPGCKVIAVSDLRPDRLAKIGPRYPTVETTTDYNDLLKDPRIDAIAIATPVSTHFELGMAALRAGKHVLMEKPMTADAEQAQQLVDEADRRELVLAVDHTFVYTEAVRKIRDLARGGELGEIYYYDSVRVNLGLFQHDVNVIWDLAVHDLSIMDAILPAQPVAVSASGIAHVPGEPEDMAYVTLHYDSSLMAHVHVNWLAPVKLRRTLVGGSRRMVVYDDLEPSEKIKVYDKGVSFTDDPANIQEMRVGYRTGDMWAPKLAVTEALRVEGEHFIDCIVNDQIPINDGTAGLRVVRLLEAADRSLKDRGRLLSL